MGLNGKQLLENFKEDEAYGNTTYTPPDNDGDSGTQTGLLDGLLGKVGAAADWVNNNIEYVEKSPVGQWVGNNVEWLESTPVGQALAPSNSVIKNLPALLGLAINASVTPKDDDTFGGSAYNALANGEANVIGTMADFLHQDDLAASMRALADKTQDDTPVAPGLDWDYISSPHGLTRSTFNAVGSMIPTLPSVFLAPESLVAAAGRISPWLANGARFGMTAIPEAMSEGGQTRREAIEDGLDHPDLRAIGTAAKNLPLLAVSNTLEGAVLGGGLGKALAGKAGESVLARMAKAPLRATPSALVEGLQNGLEEGLQQGIQDSSLDKEHGWLPWNWNDEQWQNAAEGFWGTLPLGAIGGARKAVFPGNVSSGGSAAADSLLDQAQDDIDSITSQAAQQSVIQSAQQDMENNPYTAPTAMQDTSYEAPSDTSDTSSGSSYDASALEGDPQYTVSGEVSSTDVTPLTDQKMRLLDAAYYNKYGQHLFVTSMKRNGDGGSWHDSGQAFDTADDNLENNKEARDWLISEGEKLGLTPLDEYEHPSANATGGHIHFSDHGEPIPDGIGVGESDSDMDDSDMDDSTGGVDLSNLPVGDIAMAIAQNTNLPVNFIWSQLSHESDGGKSKLAVEDHNYGGVKGNDGNYLHFDNDQQFIDYMSKYYPKYREDGIYDAQTADQFAEALQHGGYFTADLGEYEGGMHRYLEQAGLSQDAMFGGKARRAGRKGGDSTSSTPDLSGSFEISADDPAMDSMFASFAKDWQNMSTDANEINFFGDMFTSRDKFKATEENKQAILDNYGDAFRQYVQENQPQTVQATQTAQAPAQPKQAPQPQHIEMQTPNLQTITTPKVEAATIQNVLSSFVQDKKNVARTEQEANLFDDMLDADDHFIDTPKNRQTLLKNYGAQLQDYVDDAMTPSLTDRVNQAIEQAVQNKDLNRMNTLTQAKQANDTAALEKLVGPQTKQHVDIAAMLTPANTDMKNHVSSTVQANAPVYQTATMEHQAPQTEVASTVQGNVPVNQVAATEDEQKAFRKAGLVYRDSNYNGTERVKTAPLYEEGDRRMNGGKSETKVKAQTAGKADKYKKDAEKIYLRFKSGKFSTEDSIKQLNNLKKKATSDKALSDEDRADVIAEADKHINRIKPQKETKEHETQKHNSKTTKTTQSGEAEGYPHQDAKPEKGRTDAEESEVKASSHFDTSDFKHTKTGEMIPAAKISSKVDADTYKAINSIAKKHGGYYNRYAKRFLFNKGGADGRDAFVEEAERSVFNGADSGTKESKAPVSAGVKRYKNAIDKIKKQYDDGEIDIDEYDNRFFALGDKWLRDAHLTDKDKKEVAAYSDKIDAAVEAEETRREKTRYDFIKKAAKSYAATKPRETKVTGSGNQILNDDTVDAVLKAQGDGVPSNLADYVRGVTREDVASIPDKRKKFIDEAIDTGAFRAIETDRGGYMLIGTKGGMFSSVTELTPAETVYYAMHGGLDFNKRSTKEAIMDDLATWYGSEKSREIKSSKANHDSEKGKNLDSTGMVTTERTSKEAADEGWQESKDETKLSAAEEQAPSGTSDEAKQVYTIVRDQLTTSKSKGAQCAASVGAAILAHHADVYAKAYSKATGKKYTAMDYLNEKFGLNMTGQPIEGRAFNQAMSKSKATSLAEFAQIATSGEVDPNGKKKTFYSVNATNDIRVDFPIDDTRHSVNKHNLTGQQLQAIEDNLENIVSAYQDTKKKGHYGGLPVLAHIVTPIGDAGITFEFSPYGRVFVTTMFFDTKQNIENWAQKNGASRSLADDKSASSFTGHPLSISTIQQKLGIGNEKVYNQTAWHGSPYDFDRFDLGAIGTGEGAQVHGWGLYFAANREVSEAYKDALSRDVVEQKHYLYLAGNKYEYPDGTTLIRADNGKVSSNPILSDVAKLIHNLGSIDAAVTRLEKLKQGYETRGNTGRSYQHVLDALKVLNDDKTYEKYEDQKRSTARLYQVDIPDADTMLDEDKPLSEQPKIMQLLDAHAEKTGDWSFSSEELDESDTGRDFYKYLKEALHSPREASKYLNAAGINGITYNGGRDGRCYVVFDDEAVSVINKYNQMVNGKVQGETAPLENGRRVVSLFEHADESTFLHEMGHVFLLDLQDLAEVDQTAANDMAAVEGWTTWKKGQAKEYKGTAWEQEFADRENAIVKAMADGDEETVNQLKDEWAQERFARGLERYLESGEAPSSKLKDVFEKFKQFLTHIYNAFKGEGGKPSEDVQNVMARMMDSDVENTVKVPPMGKAIIGRTGKETTVTTDSGKTIRVRYRLVPTARVITSHNAETMAANKAYPQELQPRDRQRVSMQEQVTTMANELRPADLGAGRNLNQGAPIIRKDGVVLNGNGRAMAIQKATTAGGDKATAYRKYIFEHSKEFGISRSNLSQMRKYMLVREVVDDIDTDTMQDIIGSTAGGSRMGASEQAKADAKKIRPRDLERYVDNEQGDLTTAANQDFVARVLYRIVGKNERNAYTDEHGNVNADGIQRVKRALFSLAYDDDGLIDKMAESTDDNIRNVSRGLMSAAPAFARVNLAVKDGQAYEYDAAKTISDAVKHLDALRREGKPVKDYLNEQSMFSEYQDTDEVRDVLRFFDDNKRSGKKIGIFLNDIANSIMMQGDPNQTSLMGGGRATLGEIIKTSARVASNGTSSADLFADVQEAPTKAKENTTQAIDDIRYSAKQNDAQVKRSLQAVVDEAKKAFPNAKNIRQDGGHISMDMPNGAEVQINVVPSIEVNNEEAGRARAAHGLKDDVRIKINGGERTVGRTALIELSQLGRKGTAYHEAFHAVYDMCLTNEEKAALHKAYDKEAKAKGRDVYEVMADKYRDWMLAQQKGQHTLFGKLWQKVKSAVIRLLHLIRGADNARDVFRKVGSGEVWERQLNSKDSGNRYLVTNDQIRPDTDVPIIDVTDEPKVNVNNHHAAADIARSMIGKTFRIIGSDGYGKIASVSDGTHFVHSSNNPVRFDKTRRKALSVAEKILGNCVYIEKHGDLKHGTKQSYIEMFSVVKDGNRLVRFRIVAKEGNKDSHAFRIGEAKFYDIIKDGALQESGVLRHYKHEGAPSTLTIAELLKGVKDREGHLYVNKDGSLNYDTRIFHNGEEQGGSPSDVRNSADLFAIRPGEPIRYSLDANDNSKPSLFTRAYNHLTGRKNAASHDKNVKAMLEDITKMRIRFGKLDPKTETVFKKFEGVIRARNANEWEKVLPEAGRAIADRLNLKPSEDMNNYIAKWLLDEATNDTSQEASDFAAALKNDPVLSDQLVDLKTLFNERNNREADEVVRDAIQYEKPKERTTLTKAWETFYDEMIEELGPVKRMVKRVQEKSGQELAASVNPYIALRLFRGNAGRAMTMIEGQSEAAVKALQTNYPGVNFNGFKTLHMILDECGALHNEKRMKDFLAFALACHVKDIHTLNNRIRKSQQRLRDKIADLNDKINNLPEYQQLIESDKKVDDKYQEQREAYQKEIEGYQAKIDKAEKTIMEVPRTEDGLSLTEDRCNKVMMKYMKEYGEAQQDLVHFSKVTTSILYNAGVISKKRYKELQERWPNYIPMFRVFEDNEEVDFGDSLKPMHGSTRRIINPLDSIIRNTYDFVKKAERNKARQLLADLTRISDVGEYIEEVDNSKPNDKTTITFYENGERKYLQTDPDIVKAVNNMGREESNWVLRLLHGPAKIARACFTTINPSFALRNLIRDSTDATIYSKYGFKPWDFAYVR